MKPKGTVKYVLSAVLAGVLVWLAVRGIDWKSFVDGLLQTRWSWIVLFLVASVAALVFREERWRLLLKPMDGSVRPLRVWDSINVGNLVNIALPGAGEIVRCGYVSSKRLSFDKVLGSIVAERAWDFLAVALLLVLAFSVSWNEGGDFFRNNIAPLFSSSLSAVLWAVLIIAAILIVCLAVFRFRDRNRLCAKIADVFKGLWTGFAIFGKMEHKARFVASTLMIWVSYVTMSYCTMKALPALDHLGFTDALLISAIGNIASIIPVPGGIGAYHGAIAVVLQTVYSTSWETGILYATLNHEFHAVLVLLLGIISYANISLGKKKE